MEVLLLCSLFLLTSTAPPLISPHISEGDNNPVCIIGAGLAGLSAAAQLQKAGIRYNILEGSGRVGGRVYPLEYEDGFLQYGATYINGEKNPIYEIAKDNNLIDFDATNAADDYVPIYTEEEVIQGCDVKEFAAFTEQFVSKYRAFSKNGLANETFKQAFDEDYQIFLEKKNRESRRSHFDRLARMFITDMETEWAALMNRYALFNYETYNRDAMPAEGTEFTLNKLGFGKILEVIKSRVPTAINFNTEVTNIDYTNEEKIVLKTAGSNSTFVCSSVIVTVSLGYLKKHSPTLFTPQLPAPKTAAIKELGFGNMQKLFLIYDEPWLEKSAYHTMGPSNSTIFGRGLTFDVTPWSKKAVQFWFSGPAVEAIGKLSDEQLIDEITEHLRKTLKNITVAREGGCGTAQQENCIVLSNTQPDVQRPSVPRANKVIRHMWYNDPLILGSYSYITDSAASLGHPNQKLAEPILGKNGRLLVQFAGEATHSTIYQTTIGAFLSGQREAERLIKNRDTKKKN